MKIDNPQGKARKLFLEKEGNAWFERNKEGLQITDDNPYLHAWERLPQVPTRVLEIGCSNGVKLASLYQHYPQAHYSGIDPSEKAVEAGNKSYPFLKLKQGSADVLPFNNKAFDAIIFGFCLYLCDKEDWFRIAYEADRCLNDKGYIIIVDFYSSFYYRNTYKHAKNIFSHKYNYASMFLWNPQYTLIEVFSLSQRGNFFVPCPDERISLQTLYKNVPDQFIPTDPFAIV